MSAEGSVAGAALVSLLSVWVLTPAAIRLATRTGFLDHPRGYKAHGVPTAYLGGIAVIGGFAVAALPFAAGVGEYTPLIACAVGLALIGTIDDRRPVRPLLRVCAEIAAAAVLTATGLGWTFLGSDLELFVLNSIWIVGFTNAFNLMDNMDGAAGTVGAVCAGGIAAFALGEGRLELAAFAIAISAACAAFLRFNLRPGGRARIFLGDGGSMPLGFLLAASAMQIPVGDELGWPVLLVAALMLGILALDTLLVVVSRTRRGVSLATGGRDHLTHRLHRLLGSPAAVAAVLAAGQALLTLVAVAAFHAGRTTIVATASVCIVLGAALVYVLDSETFMALDESPA